MACDPQRARSHGRHGGDRALTLGVSYVLVFMTQGQDLSRGIGEDGLRQPGMIIFAALAAFPGGAGLDLGAADRRRLFRRRSRQMGAVAETRVSGVVAAAARRGAGFRSGAVALSPSRTAHRYCARDGRARRAVHRRGLGPQASRAGVGRTRVRAAAFPFRVYCCAASGCSQASPRRRSR